MSDDRILEVNHRRRHASPLRMRHGAAVFILAACR